MAYMGLSLCYCVQGAQLIQTFTHGGVLCPTSVGPDAA